MDNMVDVRKTRRRIEEHLRKYVDTETLVSIAERLGVEVAFIPIPEVSELELEIAEALEKGIPSGFEGLVDFTTTLLPRKFTVYYASFVDPEKPDEEPHRWSFSVLTRERAENGKPPRANSVSEEKLNILEIRGLLQRMREEGNYIATEDKEMLEGLERVVFKS